MKMTHMLPAAVAAALAFAACASDPPKPVVMENLVQRTATVMAIDQSTRLVTLQDEEGGAATIQVSEEVRNLPQVKEGDKVLVSYYEAIAAEVKKPGEGVEGVQADVSTARAPEGSMPGAGAGMLLRTTVTIESVDTDTNTVAFTRSSNADAISSQFQPCWCASAASCCRRHNPSSVRGAAAWRAKSSSSCATNPVEPWRTRSGITAIGRTTAGTPRACASATERQKASARCPP